MSKKAASKKKKATQPDTRRELAARLVNVADLIPDPRNAKLHDRRNIDGIKGSLVTFGQREPLAIRHGVVIGGNGRVTAMLELGWKQCWVTDHDDLTDAQAHALGVILNRTAEVGTSWDSDALRITFAELADEWPSVDLGFLDAELVALGVMPGALNGHGPEDGQDLDGGDDDGDDEDIERTITVSVKCPKCKHEFAP